jgi:hypothetical protein
VTENVRRLRPELWRQNNWLLHHDNASSHTSFFTREFFPFPDWRWNWKASILKQLRWSRLSRKRSWTLS